MSRISDQFCSGLPANTVTSVPVPRLVWGVSGVNTEEVAGTFSVQLIDVSNESSHRVLDSFTLPQGFPENTPLVQRDNYPGRLASIRVISNPRFKIGSVMQTFFGCFTAPGSTQALDPAALMIRVDPTDQIDEGNRENDNDLRF
jgi:hypothetical protein